MASDAEGCTNTSAITTTFSTEMSLRETGWLGDKKDKVVITRTQKNKRRNFASASGTEEPEDPLTDSVTGLKKKKSLQHERRIVVGSHSEASTAFAIRSSVRR